MTRQERIHRQLLNICSAVLEAQAAGCRADVRRMRRIYWQVRAAYNQLTAEASSSSS